MSRPGSNRRQNLQGEEFGLLTALFPEGATGSGHAIWICGCSCGNPERQEFTSRELLHNGMDSCGCRPRRLRKDGKAYRKYDKPNTVPDGLSIVTMKQESKKRTFVTLSNKTTETLQVICKMLGLICSLLIFFLGLKHGTKTILEKLFQA